jgi:hypothetical protein
METKIVSFEAKVKDHAIGKLTGGIGLGVIGCDLHNKLFNEDYYVIGYYAAEQMLLPYGIFAAIGKV